MRRTLYCIQSNANPSHSVASAHSARAMHTQIAYMHSPTCALPRNGDWLPATGISARALSPRNSTATPDWPIGPSGTHAANTPTLPAGNPYNISRQRYTTRIAHASPSPTDKVHAVVASVVSAPVSACPFNASTSSPPGEDATISVMMGSSQSVDTSRSESSCLVILYFGEEKGHPELEVSCTHMMYIMPQQHSADTAMSTHQNAQIV
jgi:hypothetical protein